MTKFSFIKFANGISLVSRVSGLPFNFVLLINLIAVRFLQILLIDRFIAIVIIGELWYNTGELGDRVWKKKLKR